MTKPNTDMLIRQADAKTNELFKIGLQWCVDTKTDLDIRNYMMICIKMIITQGLQIVVAPEDRGMFFDQIIEKLIKNKALIIESAED